MSRFTGPLDGRADRGLEAWRGGGGVVEFFEDVHGLGAILVEEQGGQQEFHLRPVRHPVELFPVEGDPAAGVPEPLVAGVQGHQISALSRIGLAGYEAFVDVGRLVRGHQEYGCLGQALQSRVIVGVELCRHVEVEVGHGAEDNAGGIVPYQPGQVEIGHARILAGLGIGGVSVRFGNQIIDHLGHLRRRCRQWQGCHKTKKSQQYEVFVFH